MSNFIVNPYRFAVGETEYEQLLGTTNTVQVDSVNFGQGIGINADDSKLIGTKPTKISFYGDTYGSPSGDTYVVICDYRDSPPLSNILATSNIINANTWGGGNAWHEYEFAGTYTLKQYDSINFIYMSGDTTNYIITKQLSTAQPFETGKCFWNLGTESEWVGNTIGAQDARFKLTVIG